MSCRIVMWTYFSPIATLINSYWYVALTQNTTVVVNGGKLTINLQQKMRMLLLMQLRFSKPSLLRVQNFSMQMMVCKSFAKTSILCFQSNLAWFNFFVHLWWHGYIIICFLEQNSNVKPTWLFVQRNNNNNIAMPPIL